jgi:hypothetical protein
MSLWLAKKLLGTTDTFIGRDITTGDDPRSF